MIVILSHFSTISYAVAKSRYLLSILVKVLEGQGQLTRLVAKVTSHFFIIRIDMVNRISNMSLQNQGHGHNIITTAILQAEYSNNNYTNNYTTNTNNKLYTAHLCYDACVGTSCRVRTGLLYCFTLFECLCLVYKIR